MESSNEKVRHFFCSRDNDPIGTFCRMMQLSKKNYYVFFYSGSDARQKVIKDMVEKVAFRHLFHDVKFVLVDLDQNPQIQPEYKKGLPLVYMFSNGKLFNTNTVLLP